MRMSPHGQGDDHVDDEGDAQTAEHRGGSGRTDHQLTGSPTAGTEHASVHQAAETSGLGGTIGRDPQGPRQSIEPQDVRDGTRADQGVARRSVRRIQRHPRSRVARGEARGDVLPSVDTRVEDRGRTRREAGATRTEAPVAARAPGSQRRDVAARRVDA